MAVKVKDKIASGERIADMMMFAARVEIPMPLKGEAGDSMLQYGYAPTEIMIDMIKARDVTEASDIALVQAHRVVSYEWGNDPDLSMLPDPQVLDCAVLDEQGRPLRQDFPLPQLARTRVSSTMSGGIAIQTKKAGDAAEEEDDDYDPFDYDRRGDTPFTRASNAGNTGEYPAGSTTSSTTTASKYRTILDLDDPFTDEIITLIAMKVPEVKEI